MPFDLIKYIWEVWVRMNVFKQPIRKEIYLFMFMLGGFSTLRTAPQRWGCSADGRGDVISNERCCHPHSHPHPTSPHPTPNLQGAEPARRSRSEPNNLFGGRSAASLYILPAFPCLTAGRRLRLVLERCTCFESRDAGEIVARISAIFTWLQCPRRRFHDTTCLCAR